MWNKIDKGKIVIGLFIDLAKAFADHTILLSKLEKLPLKFLIFF